MESRLSKIENILEPYKPIIFIFSRGAELFKVGSFFMSYFLSAFSSIICVTSIMNKNKKRSASNIKARDKFLLTSNVYNVIKTTPNPNSRQR